MANEKIGKAINENNDSTEKIRIKIEKASAIFTKMKRILSSRNLGLEQKIRLMTCYLLPVLFYGMDAWI